MKMKNVFMLLLGAMLVLSMVGVGAAEVAGTQTPAITELSLDGEGKATQQTTVTLALSQSFEVTLPADFDLTDDKNNGEYTGLALVNTTVHLLNPGKMLTVSVSSPNNDGYVAANPGSKYWILKEQNVASPKELRYIISATDSDSSHVNTGDQAGWLSEGTNFIEISAPTPLKTTYLHFKLAESLSVATVGTYKDTLTFKVAVVNTPSQAST